MYSGGPFVVDSRFIFPPIVGVLCLFHVSLCSICVLSGFAIILMGKRALVVLLFMTPCCLVNVIVPFLFLTVPRAGAGLQCVIVVFPDHIHLFLFRHPDKNALQKNIFLISQPKHMLWVLKRVSMRRFFEHPKHM